MKIYLISDNIDTKIGMRLSGIDGVVVDNSDQAKEAMQGLLSDKTIGIILVTEKVGVMLREYVDMLKMSLSVPLIVEIPDRHGTMRQENSITKYVREAIGVSI